MKIIEGTLPSVAAWRAVAQRGASQIYPILAVGSDYGQSVAEFVTEAKADLLLLQAEGLSWHRLNRVSCAVAVVRGHRYSRSE
jgi:hypothetical protein